MSRTVWMDEQPEPEKKEIKNNYQYSLLDRKSMELVIEFIFAVTWICGIVIIPGYWKILGIFPPYAWYKFAEKMLQFYGVI
jgi:hypothetical protein